MENKIAIIDLDSLAFYAGHPNKYLDEDGEPKRTEDGARFLYVDKTEAELKASVDYLMNSLLSKGKFDGYIAYIKGKNTILERKEINVEYKDNRNKEAPKWWPIVKDYFISNWNAVSVDNMEVDDAVNITRLKVPESFICAIDKDLLNLHGTHYNWSKDLWVETNKDVADYEFWKDMIVGQSGDNIKGVPGVGKANEIFTKQLFKPNAAYVLELYIRNMGEETGISEFYKNYKSLRILSSKDGFVIPEIIKYSNVGAEKIEEW
jgi:DNA polymerase-1